MLATTAVHRHNWKWKAHPGGCFQSALSVHRLWKVQTVCRAMEQPCSLGIEPYSKTVHAMMHTHTHTHTDPPSSQAIVYKDLV